MKCRVIKQKEDNECRQETLAFDQSTGALYLRNLCKKALQLGPKCYSAKGSGLTYEVSVYASENAGKNVGCIMLNK